MNQVVYTVLEDGSVRLTGWLTVKDGDGTLHTQVRMTVPKGYEVWENLSYDDFIRRAEQHGSLLLDDNGALIRFSHEE